MTVAPAATKLRWTQVTSWRLSRLHLARRVAASRMVSVVSRLCGAHAQLASSVPLALGARVFDLRHERVDAAVQEDRTLVKTWAMRGTLHVLAAEDLPLYCAAQRTRDQYMNASFLKYVGLDFADVDAVLDAVPRALDGQMLTREALTDRILAITKRPHLEDRLRSGWGELLKPAAVARWWGVRPPEAGRVLTLMQDELAQVEVGGAERWVLASDLRAMARARPVEGVRLLPSFDQLLVMSAPHAESIVDDAFAGRVYRPRIAVWSLPAVLIDGRVGASWLLDRMKGRAVVRVKPFARLGRSSLAALEAEADALGTLLRTDVVLDVTV